ncbi:SusC/RagA family TonB-linked outer membrane protein [Phaeodactylibacter xiamenensis]|uniref:SusC/RagA family TonB-linked outer membrane protein n=1 Tax=Phaeodactylibacter xiamenensis TaxID=1524460 RepID=UPI003BAC5AF0
MKKLSLVLGLVVFAIGSMLAQRTVTGTISDQNGDPLLGASILVKGTTTGTITDIDGAYSINVKGEDAIFVVSYTGFETMEVEVGNQTALDITMTEGVNLQEVVVAALGIERQEKALGYSVQEVSGAELAETKEVNVVNSLNGKVAGIQIQGAPSSLGGSSRITIRGSNSFLGDNQPLFVVDGIPLDNSNFASNAQMRGFGGGTAYDYGNTIQDIDPESIESMTVLKGAAASALYGQRGANGVILITTKDGSGRKGKGIGVEVNSSMTLDQVNNLIPHQQEYGGGALNTGTPHGFNTVIQDGQEYLYPSYSKDGSWGPKYDPNRLVRHWDSWDPGSPLYKEVRPWVAPNSGYEDFFETGQTLQNSIALSGANDQGNFRLGFTNLSQAGTMPNGELERNTLTFNSGYKIHDRVRVELAGNYVRTDAQNRNVTGYNNGNPMQAFTQWWQTQLDMDRLRNDVRTDGFQQTWNARGPQKDADNNLLFYDEQPNFFDNPFWVRENFLQEDTRNRFFGNGQVVVDLAEGLSLSGRAGTDFYQFSTREGIPIQSVETSYYGEEERRFQETNMEAKLSYNKDFDRISLNVVAGGNRMHQFIRRTSAETNGGLALDGFYNISNSLASPIVSTNEQEWGINSVFGLASIGFDNWLYMDVTARNDWSSTLPEGSNSYFYPSVSLSAVISDLPVFGGAIGPISFAKVRASYAQVGLDADPYRLTDVFSPQVPNYMGNPRYAVPNGQNNPNLGPELTSEYEFGLDLRMFNGRFGIDIAYYDRTTEDQIFSVPASAATGYTSKILNAGEMRNYGVEFQVNVVPIETEDFQWNITLNALRQNNEVVSLADGVESIARGGTWAADLRIAEGLPYMAIFGQDYVFNENGERLVDEDGFYQFTSERVFLGSAVADWTGGLQTGFRYKGLFGSVLFDFQKGGAIHSTSLQWSKYSGMHPETVSFNGIDDIRAEGLILPGVKEDGTPNDIAVDPQVYYQTYWNRAAPNVFEASFIKLRDVRLGYKIPNRLFGKAPFRDVTVSIFGRNLAILTADLPYLDPQIITGAGNDQGLENAQIPSTRSMGVNLSFKL